MNAEAVPNPRRRRLPIKGRRGEGELALLEFGDPSRPVDLVFLHANGFNALTYRTLLAPLAQGLRIVAPDLRGHGHTRLPTGTKGRFDWLDLRDDILALLESIEGPPVVLAGHSMGATTALLAAEQRPDRVRGLVLLDPVIWPRHLAPFLGLPGLRRLSARAPIARAALRRRPGFDSPEAAFAAYCGRGAFKGWPDPVLADYLADGLVVEDEGQVMLACAPEWEASNYAAQGHNAWRALRRLVPPARVLKGEVNSTCSLKDGDFERVRVETVPGGTHFFPMLQPEAARAALRAATEG